MHACEDKARLSEPNSVRSPQWACVASSREVAYAKAALGTWVSSSATIRLTSGYRALCNNGGIGWALAAVRLQSLLAAALPLIFGSL